MKRLHGIALAGITAAVAFSTAAGEAGALTWTPVNSGTTDPITAIDYTRGQLRFATAAGNIFVRRPDGGFALEASFPGRQFFDIAFRPSGAAPRAAPRSRRRPRGASSPTSRSARRAPPGSGPPTPASCSATAAGRGRR